MRKPVFLPIFAFTLITSMFHVCKAQTMPEAQLRVCAIQERVVADLEHYKSLDEFARQGAKPPDNSVYDKMLFSILGPTGAFENWVGTVRISAPIPPVPGFAVMNFVFDCPDKPNQQNFVFTSSENSTMDFTLCPGAGLHPTSAPVTAALIRIPDHRSPALVTGHLYQYENTGLYRGGNCTTRDTYVRNYNGFAAALTRVALPSNR